VYDFIYSTKFYLGSIVLKNHHLSVSTKQYKDTSVYTFISAVIDTVFMNFKNF